MANPREKWLGVEHGRLQKVGLEIAENLREKIEGDDEVYDIAVVEYMILLNKLKRFMQLIF